MDFADRLKEIDGHLVKPHAVLNRIAIGQLVETADVHEAIAEITRARELLTDGAGPSPLN